MWLFLLFYVLVLNFVLRAPYVRFNTFCHVWVTEWSSIGIVAANSASYMFSW